MSAINYKATAEILDDEGKIISMSIFNLYKTVLEAIEDVKNFAKHGYSIINIKIERIKNNDNKKQYS